MKSVLIPSKEMGVHEECGIVGVQSTKKKPLAREVYFALFALQHRGQESAGIAVSYDGNKVAYYKNMGLVSEVFSEEELGLLPDTKAAIGHVRYSTTGSSNVINAQPVVFYGRYGRMALAHNGNIVNNSAIRDEMIKRGHIFQSSTDSEVIAALINEYSTESVEQGIHEACKRFVGAFALVILTGDKIIAVRDKYGLKPLVMGEKDGDVLFASESCALDAIDARVIRDVNPGEIITVESGGKLTSSRYADPSMKPCIFEYVYLARSDSTIDDVSVYDSRYECGRMLAELYKIDADIVSGVPDSAVVRESSVKIKLNAFRSNIKGKRLILIDDSIVRGTTSKKIISLLRASGATEVHMIVASPVVKFPCYFGVDMETKEQLIGGYRNEDEICKIIGADSLHYIPLELLKKACGGKDYCTGCFNADYAENVESVVKSNKTANE